MKQLWAGAILLSAAAWGETHHLGTTGYGRIQTAFEDNKAGVCFKAPGAGSKYRLGNECESWIELGFYDTIRFENGVVMHNQVRPVFTAPNNRHIEYLRLDEIYSEISGIFDNPVSFWAGRRFYERYDSHMSDYFFFNMSGEGAGLRNLEIGGYRLSYSYMFERLDPPGVEGNEKVLYDSHDLRLSRPTERGEWTVFVNRMELRPKTFGGGERLEGSAGYGGGLLYKDTKITQDLFGMEGENITALFYGDGVAKGAGSTSPYLQENFVDAVLASGSGIDRARTWRFVNYNGFDNESWGLLSNVVLEKRKEMAFSSTDQTWISAGVRPYWFFHRNGRLVAEAGFDRVKDHQNDRIFTLTKTTVALEGALERGVWKRPVLRLYYTYADWSENAQGLVGGSVYGAHTHGENGGIQLEYWW